MGLVNLSKKKEIESKKLDIWDFVKYSEIYVRPRKRLPILPF